MSDGDKLSVITGGSAHHTVVLSIGFCNLLFCYLVLRYPLIIDPSGQATEFIMNEYKDRKITRTSFLDDAFRKNLESALRFGNPLLVQVCVYLSPSDPASDMEFLLGLH